MSRLHLNIGSNQGDRHAIIGKAAALIARALAPCRILLSDCVESEPWGFDSPCTFVNRGLLVITDRTLDPFEVLRAVQTVEKALTGGAPHRNTDGTYRDRLLDIDLIDLDHLRLSTPTLTLPHPRAAQRPFVTAPLVALDPAFPLNTLSQDF